MTTANGANLRQSRKELAAMTKAPAKRAPARKAPAKKPAGKPAGLPATPKLKWAFPEGFDQRHLTGQMAAYNGGTLAMRPVDGKWSSTYTKGGKTQTLVEGVGAGAAYKACVQYTRKGVAA
jgi:hypothetical protein